ncbi:hypothetical protein BDY24DRAFT_440296 [Mrakia frigida]|uniref:uncharacterized protein n=1 Tax=Mrakia frigida TaxID=29902 RepID=UPI003FCBF9BD
MSRPELHINTGNEEDEGLSSQDEYSDEGESSSASIDPDIDFDLNYALHTFVATVEGQASVVKGDSLVLLDDTNSYWWLVNVLKTEDVGYIPAENIETPYERLARLNKFRNVDIAAATQEEKNVGLATSRLQLRNVLSAAKTNPGSRSPSPTDEASIENGGKKGVKFSAPTYVEHPGNQGWSEDEDDEEGDYEEGDEGEDYDEEGREGEEMDEEEARLRDELEAGAEGGSSDGHGSFGGMEPDDGMSWDDRAGEEDQAANHLTASSSFSSSDSMDGNLVKDGPQARQAEVVGQQQSQQVASQSSPEQSARSSAQQQQQAELGRGVLLPSQLQPSQQQQITRSTSTSSVVSQTTSLGSPVSLSQSTFAPSSSRDLLDPALDTGETRRIYATPAVARSTPPQGYATGEALSEMTRHVSGGSARSEATESHDDGLDRESDVVSPNGERAKRARKEEEEKSKKKGVFGSLFRKKDKKDKGIRASTVISDAERDSFNGGRSSEDDSTARSPGSTFDSPPSGPGGRSSSSASSRVSFNSTDPKRSNSLTSTSGSQAGVNISPHGLRLQQIDQKQQALYHEYLSTAVVTTPERAPHPSLSYGSQAAATVAQSSAAQRMARASLGGSSPRPGSILVVSTSGSSNAGLAGAAASTLSVLRVFAGAGVESDSTFKTALLNETTTTDDLVKQAIQRFRLGTAEQADDYVLIVKGVNGEEEVLGSEGHPLVVFNSLNQEDPNLVKTVRRSSIGSISSISSNLSLNPAIARLGDWSDDSLVKLYLSKRADFVASASNTSSLSTGEFLSAEPLSPLVGSSPATRFTLQVVIRPEDLPEGMVFDPTTDTLVPRSRSQRLSSQPSSPSHIAPPSPALSQTERVRFFLLPANTTVAEAIEVALERFGITEGVVDGGDEVEDKLSKRKSLARVRYGLSVRASGGEERVLHPSTKLVDSYSTPPNYRTPPPTDPKERRRSREISTAHPEDVQSSDPVFIIRRAQPRGTNLSLLSSPRRSRSSVNMDLSNGSIRSSTISDRSARQLSAKASASSLGSDRTAEDLTVTEPRPTSTSTTPTPSRQEIIAAQRAASRANQLAILSANTNASQGIDLVMSDRGTVRSSRLFVGGVEGTTEQVRYSYIEPDGETTYDISELIEQEWTPPTNLSVPQDKSRSILRTPSPSEGDVLEGALAKPTRESKEFDEQYGAIDQKIDRVLQKVRSGSVKPLVDGSGPSSSTLPSNSASQTTIVPAVATSTSTTPTSRSTSSASQHRKQPSVASISSLSRSSGGGSPSTSAQTTTTTTTHPSTTSNPTPPNPLPAPATRLVNGRPVLVTRDDFGVKNMLAVINARAREPMSKQASMMNGTTKRDQVEEKLFGVKAQQEGRRGTGAGAGAGAGGGGGELGGRFDEFDRELDRLLEGVLRLGRKSSAGGRTTV